MFCHGHDFPGFGCHGHGLGHHMGHGMGLGLLGIGLAIASEITEDAREERAQEAAERRHRENWVICACCGRKFDFNAEGGSYSRVTSAYACPACQAREAARPWTCSHCGAPAVGSTCEYCGSPHTEADAFAYQQGNSGAYGTPWTCPTCGRHGTGRFCTHCGRVRG